MLLKTIQWNIGGGRLLRPGADPTLLDSYSRDGTSTIIAFLQKYDPDIITLQETHAKDGLSQPQQIAEKLGYTSWVNDEWADSHLEPGWRIGQGIISRYPFESHEFALFNNPRFEAVWEDGTIAKSHDKGRTRCTVKLENGKVLSLQTLHTTPFRRFNIPIDSERAKKVLVDMGDKLATSDDGIIQADFNLNVRQVLPLFPKLVQAGYREIPLTVPTSVRAHYYDHILYKGLHVIDNVVITDVLTDHYPVITTFELD